MKPTVVIVPGFGGSAIVSARHPSIRNTWLSPRLVLKGSSEWLSVNRSSYDPLTHTYSAESSAGTGLSAVRDLVNCPFPNVNQTYFGDMIDRLSEKSYVVAAAPFDFRTVLNNRCVGLFKAIDRAAGTSRVVIVAHSMGAVLARAALSDQHLLRRVAGLVEICPAHGGCLASIESMAEGVFYTPMSRREKRAIAVASRDVAGLVLTLPNPSGFNNRAPVFVERGGRSYYPGGPWPWRNVDDSWRHLASHVLDSVSHVPTRVSHTVVYSSGFPSPAAIDRSLDVVEESEGDGILTTSSMLCRLSDHSLVINSPSANHRGAPQDPSSIKAVADMLSRLS